MGKSICDQYYGADGFFELIHLQGVRIEGLDLTLGMD